MRKLDAARVTLFFSVLLVVGCGSSSTAMTDSGSKYVELTEADFAITKGIKQQAIKIIGAQEKAQRDALSEELSGLDDSSIHILFSQKMKEEQPHIVQTFRKALKTLDKRDEDGVPPLMNAIFTERPDIVQEMLKQGASPDFPTITQRGKLFPLVSAIHSGQYECAKLLLEAEADTSVVNGANETSLEWLKQQPNLPEVKRESLEDYVDALLDSRNSPSERPKVLSKEQEQARLFAKLREREIDWIQRDLVITELFKKHPSHPQVTLRFAELLTEKEEYPSAIGILNSHLEANATDVRALCLLGKLYYDQKKYNKSLLLFNKALTFEASDGESRYRRAKVHWKLQDYAAAISDIDAAEKVGYWPARVLGIRGMCSFAQGDANQAIKYYQQAIDADPNYHSPYYQLAWVQNRVGSHAECKRLVSLAIACNPLYARAYNLRGNALGVTDELAAVTEYQHAVRVAPSDYSCTHAKSNLANTYLKYQMAGEVLILTTDILFADPAYAKAYKLRAKASRMLGDSMFAREDEQKHQYLTGMDTIKAKLGIFSFHDGAPRGQENWVGMCRVMAREPSGNPITAEWVEAREERLSLATFFLMHAALKNDEVTVDVCIDIGGDLNVTGPNGDTLLHLAARHTNNLMVIRTLLRQLHVDPQGAQSNSSGESVADVLIQRCRDSKRFAELFEENALAADDWEDNLPGIVDAALGKQIDNVFETLDGLAAEHREELAEARAAEKKISELEGIIGASSYSPGQSRRQHTLEMNERHSRWDAEREMRNSGSGTFASQRAVPMLLEVKKIAGEIYATDATKLKTFQQRLDQSLRAFGLKK